MTVEVKAEALQVAEEQEKAAAEEAETVEGAVEREKDDSKPKLVQKSSSDRERESNFLSDLKEHEKKALNEMKTNLEETLLPSALFKNRRGGGVREGEKKSETNEVEADKDISIWVVPLLPSKGNDSTNIVLTKFLRAREFKVNDALEMLKKTLQWRKEFNIDSILDEEFEAELASAVYMDGVDCEGHAICYNIFGALENEEIYEKTLASEEKTEQFLRWRVQLMEKGIQKLDFNPACVNSLLQINGLKNSPGASKKEVRVAGQ